MAYDNNGNYYFDPNIDEDDREMVADEARRKQARDFVDANVKAANEQQDVNKMWHETLESEGLDLQTYTELYNQDPAFAKSLLKDSMKNVAKNIKRGKSSEGKAELQYQRATASNTTLEAIKEKSKRGPLSEQDELSVLDAIFGADPLWKD
jgi:hypothetical protein